jgi:hypothetical protein
MFYFTFSRQKYTHIKSLKATNLYHQNDMFLCVLQSVVKWATGVLWALFP